MKSLQLTISLLFSLLLTVMFTVACDKSASDDGQAATEATQHHANEHAHDEHAHGEHAHGADGAVDTLDADDIGTRHDPPISIAEVQDGHWMCDMGTVHYTRPELGDDRCPICGMRLTKKTADHEATP